MPLSAGTRLGAYEIGDLLGAGGMGEVYRARDPKLGRDVAIKILPDAFAADPDRLARFQREAQVLASLNHPHIGAIYGIEESGGMRALVLELVDGPTLADRLARGPLALDDALAIASQICDALEAAHEKGVIHRDLKPANIKLTPDGRVKVLDFGLARMLEPPAALVNGGGTGEAAARNASMSPTLSVHGTFAGVILGTAAYMSPEQAKGKPADPASDVWAFGCVLYEMLTGRKPFDGETVSEILAEVLKTEPDWQRLPPATPGAIRRLLRRCLQKDRARRVRHIADARLDIDDARVEPVHAGAIGPAGAWHRQRFAWMSALALLMLAAAGAALFVRRPPVPSWPEMRVDIVTPPTTDPISLAISPDGRQLVFASRFEDRSRLWLRALDTPSARPLPGTDDAVLPFWSPDGQSIGFFADLKLKRIDLAGGSAQVLADVSTVAGGSWNRDGTIIYSPSNIREIYRIPAAGGTPRATTRLISPGGHRGPQFLPDGNHFIYTAGGPSGARSVVVGQLEGSGERRLVDAESGLYESSGHLLFVRQGTLFAQPLDLVRLVLTGSPSTIAPQIATEGNAQGNSAVSTSVAGPFIYRGGTVGGDRQLAWIDRTGRTLATVGEPTGRLTSNLSSSPDGRRVAMQRSNPDGSVDIWTINVERGLLNRFTTAAGIAAYPVWSPDGRWIAFNSPRGEANDLYRKAADGVGTEELLVATPESKQATDWSPDGRFLMYRSREFINGATDLWVLPLSDRARPIRVTDSKFDERDGQFSPDGKWIAFMSNESGRFEIYVQPFPGAGGKERISSSGGGQVRWRSDGKELFYIAADGRLTAVPMQLSPDGRSADAGTPVPLFATRVGGAVQTVGRNHYLPSPDGQRFLVNTITEETSSTPITLVLNWKPRP